LVEDGIIPFVIPSRTLAVAVMLVSALTLAGCGAKPSTTPPPESTNAYVALGDSFTAVAGTGPLTDPAFCRRGTANYPQLVAKALHLTPFADVSCGGAAPENFTQAQVVPGKGTNQPQLDAISPGTQLVTVGIGLNESLNGTAISVVLTQLCLPKTLNDPACQAYLAASDADWKKVIDAVADQLTVSLHQIRERAPHARIVLVGYPRLLPDHGSCAKRVPLPAPALARIRTTMKLVDQKYRSVATKAKVDYVDMYAASQGHDVCSANPWVNGYQDLKGKAFAFHPFASYHRAVADAIVALLKQKPQA
jgi:hypothetical protein